MGKQKVCLDLKDKKFGYWTVLYRAENKYNKSHWVCKCLCGNEKSIAGSTLISGRSTKCASCNIKKVHTKHGFCVDRRKIPEYHIWRNMKYRCTNPKAKRWSDYGGRGIKVCKEWLNSFQSFYNDMGEKPFNRATLDRVNNEKGYCKENCRWVPYSVQNRNRRGVKLYKGLTLTELCRDKNICRFWVANRLKKGCHLDEILTDTNAPKFKEYSK